MNNPAEPDYIHLTSRFINTTGSPIFLTGKAGTGKTTFLKNLALHTYKNFIVVAPTGIAALNAGGVTIHSQFLIPPCTYIPERQLPENLSDGGRFVNSHTLARKHPLNSVRKQVLRSIDLLVIDEVSMLRADLLDAIDYRMKAARGNFSQSFGGVQVLFIGDLFQLPPVVQREEQHILGRYYNSPWFYDAIVLKNNQPVYIELDKIFRQSDDQFIRILNNLRNNRITADDVAQLNEHYQTPEQISDLREVITLTTHNHKADQLNRQELANLESSAHYFDALIEGDFPESMYPVLPQLELKEGAQIMFVRNDTSVLKQYFNGKLATVVRIEDDEVWVRMAETDTLYQLVRERWENKRYAVDDDRQVLNETVIGAFEQYPVKLAWAITVHKSQGLTFDKAIIDVAAAFAEGQVYVALSRLRSLDGLILRTRINPEAVRTDRAIVSYTEQAHQPEKLQTEIQTQQQVFIRQLLNTTFSFDDILKEIHFIHKNKEPDDQLEDPTMKPVLLQIADALEHEKGNLLKFRNQLNQLLETNNRVQLLERIEKGSLYYRQLVIGQMRILLHHLEAMKQRKRVKTYVSQLHEIDQALSKKNSELHQMLVTVSEILNGTEAFDFSSVKQKQEHERKQLLTDVQVLPSGEPKKTKRKLKAKTDKSTYDITFELLKEGLTPEAIAQKRELTLGTIEGHLAKGVETSQVDIHAFMQEHEVQEISAAYHSLPQPLSSKTLFDALKSKYGYGKLKAVIAYIDKLTASNTKHNTI